MLFHLCFFFNDTATTEIYTLSLHDALPISAEAFHAQGRPGRPDRPQRREVVARRGFEVCLEATLDVGGDRKSTRLNSSHVEISYAVFCLKKKKTKHSVAEEYCRLTS